MSDLDLVFEAMQPDADRERVGQAVRLVLDAIAERAPGRSVEIRVPPFGAVQAIAGPAHRRGTPRAVVEMDAQTLFALAVGRLRWADARNAGRVQASGERSDLARFFPLPGWGKVTLT